MKKNKLILAFIPALIISGCGANSSQQSKGNELKTETVESINNASDKFSNEYYSLNYNKDEFLVESDGTHLEIKAKSLPSTDKSTHNTVLGAASIETDEYSVDLCKPLLEKTINDLFKIDNGVTVERTEYINSSFTFCRVLSDGSESYAKVLGYDGKTLYMAVCRLCKYSENYNSKYKNIFDSIQYIGPVEVETETETETEAETEKQTEKQTTTKKEIQSWGSGQYKVGSDVKSGEYILLNTSSSRKAYFCISSDSNGDNIILNDNFAYNQIITLNDKDYIELSNCVMYKYSSWKKENKIDTTRECVLKVGSDIKAGEYKLMQTGSSRGYYSIYPNSRQSDIYNNDLFQNNTFVTVQDGQILLLSNCKIVK